MRAAAVARERDLLEHGLRRVDALLEHAREVQRVLEERHAIQAREIDRADLVIFVELEREADVGRALQFHRDAGHALADRQVLPILRQRGLQQAVEDVLAFEGGERVLPVPPDFSAAASSAKTSMKAEEASRPTVARQV